MTTHPTLNLHTCTNPELNTKSYLNERAFLVQPVFRSSHSRHGYYHFLNLPNNETELVFFFHFTKSKCECIIVRANLKQHTSLQD